MWTMMIRVDMDKLGYDTINNYSIGDWNDRYTNHIPMFFTIRKARNHTEISNLKILTENENITFNSYKAERRALYKELNFMNGNNDDE